MKKKTSILPIVLLLTAAFLIGTYPLVSNLQHRQMQKQMISDYKSAVEETTKQVMEEEWIKAWEYNRHISGQKMLNDPFADSRAQTPGSDYENLLNLNGSGVMGYIEIPKIQVRLPIVHGTADEDLVNAAGHLPGTSLPVGGKSSHAVISAHRGLPSAKLFTDLDRLEEEDIFSLYILDKILYYRVVQIEVVEPENTEDLRIVKGKDYVSLVTCTPYAINSHRLLVRAERTDKPENQLHFGLPNYLRIHIYEIMTAGIVLGTTAAIIIIMRKTKKSKV